tara:strand:+ start:262 stop:435 length:174 start_codon:yes stop_codon:yes gene_type:complete
MRTIHQITLIEVIRDAILIYLEDGNQISKECVEKITKEKSAILIDSLKAKMNEGVET